MNGEKRKAIRVKTTINVQYFLDTDRWDITTVKDISETGLSIITGKCFDKDGPIWLRIRIPSLPFDPIEVQGRVVESKDTGVGNMYLTRVEFKELTPEIKKTFHDYIDWAARTEQKS